MLRVRRLVPLALMTVLAATACGGATAAAPAAHVLGTEITDAQLATTANIFKSLFGLQHASCGQTSGVNDTDAAACNRCSLGALIQCRLSEGYASQNGVSVDDAAVQKAISAFESQVGADTLTAQLQANGVSHDDFTQLVHQSLLENEVAKHLALEKADDAQLRTQYEQNLLQYTTLTVDHILVKTKAEAEHVYQQVTAPGATREDFLALAKKVSIDP